MEKYKTSTISDKKQREKNWLIIQIIRCFNLKYVIERVPTKEEVDLQRQNPRGAPHAKKIDATKGQGDEKAENKD